MSQRKEKKKLVDRSPIVVGPPSIIQKIDLADYGMATQTSKEWRMPGVRVRHTGEGYPKKHFTIEMSDKDGLTHYHVMKTKKSAIAEGFGSRDGGKLSDKVKGKKERIPWKQRLLRTKEPESPGNIIPLIPMIPQINIKKRLLFSVAGVINDSAIAIIVPIINAIIFGV